MNNIYIYIYYVNEHTFRLCEYVKRLRVGWLVVRKSAAAIERTLARDTERKGRGCRNLLVVGELELSLFGGNTNIYIKLNVVISI